jgi:hypothetical protein
VVSHEYRCIFVHIPKCAGTSIESVFGHLQGYHGRDGQDHRSIRLLAQPVISSRTLLSVPGQIDIARRIRHHLRRGMNPRNKITVNKQQYLDYFKFAFVRNPWSRVYSMYKNVVRDEFHRSNYGIAEGIAFKEFLARFAGKGMLRPQTYWLKDADGKIPFDFIGKFENLEEDFRQTCQLLGIENIRLPHKVKGEAADYREHYDEATHHLVRKIYAEEIELFNY